MLRPPNAYTGCSAGTTSGSPHGGLDRDLCALSPLTEKIRGLRSFMNFLCGRKWLVMQNKLSSLGNQKGCHHCDDSIYCCKSDFRSSNGVAKSKVNPPPSKTPSTLHLEYLLAGVVLTIEKQPLSNALPPELYFFLTHFKYLESTDTTPP